MKLAKKMLVSLSVVFSLLAFMPAALSTTVLVQTNLGDFEINLFDQGAPETVANFLNYVQRGDYSQMIVHRSESSFVIQTGGYVFTETDDIESVETDPAVVNEPVFSNVRGTISMAKRGSDVNSATSQWFINLSDNSANLDQQNGGFSAFGVVTGDGMEIVDAIATLPVFNFGSEFTSTPLTNFSESDAAQGVKVEREHFVVVEAITITNANSDTLGDYQPKLNNILEDGDSKPIPEKLGGSGGSIGFFSLCLMLLIGRFSQGRAD